jgi:hypothetical protein
MATARAHVIRRAPEARPTAKLDPDQVRDLLEEKAALERQAAAREQLEVAAPRVEEAQATSSDRRFAHTVRRDDALAPDIEIVRPEAAASEIPAVTADVAEDEPIPSPDRVAMLRRVGLWVAIPICGVVLGVVIAASFA